MDSPLAVSLSEGCGNQGKGGMKITWDMNPPVMAVRLWHPSTQDYPFQQKREASQLLFLCHVYYFTTILTILFGTTMTFTMVLPSVNFWISGRAWAFSPISSRAIATGTEIVARTLPLT